jgi:nucleotide-binding universal stress UspA family protein
MFEHVLVAFDLSPASGPLLECLPELKRLGTRRITLLYVASVKYPAGSAIGHREEFQHMLEGHAGNLRKLNLDVDVQVVVGYPAEEIVAWSKQNGVSLILIGSRGGNLWDRIFIGSTASEVLRRSSIPVLLEQIEPVSGKQGECAVVCAQKFTRILLATDFSESARNAELLASKLAESAEHVVFMTVIEPDSEIDEAEAGNRLKTLAQSIGRDITIRVRQHKKASVEIRAVADEEDISLIIVGKRGRGYLHEKLIGSTAEAVTGGIMRPALMVPQ